LPHSGGGRHGFLDFFGSELRFRVLEPVTFSPRLDELAAKCQPIQSGPGETLGAEHLSPVLRGQVGRHQKAGSLIGRGDHIEEQFSTDFGCWDVTEFVQDQQVQLLELRPEPQEVSLVLGFN
jgi:hypothetical protein